MKIFIIKSSPRKNGNTARLADEFAAGAAESGHECRAIHLADLHIQDCTGCRACQKREACVIRADDIEKIENAIRWADIIVFATPTHWGNISGYLLRMFERVYGFLLEERRLGMPIPKAGKGKKAIVITACSTPWPFNWIFNQTRSVVSRIHEVCRYSGIKIVNVLVYPDTFERSAIPERYLARARTIGKML